MRKPVSIDRRAFLTCSMGLGPGFAFAPQRDVAAAQMVDPAFCWRVGCGRAEITPPLEVGILMSSGRGEWAPFEGVRMPIFARAALIDNGKQRVGVVALDLLGLAGVAVGGWRSFKQQIASYSGNVLAPEQIVLASSHTHSAPSSLALTDLYLTDAFKDWVNTLARRVGSALAQANKATELCRLAVASVRGAGLSVNRRSRYEGGPVDEQIRVATFADRSGRPKAIFVNATAHPVYEMCIKLVSPDYPGEMAVELESRHKGATVLFLQGASGNINPPKVSRGAAAARKHGQRLADLVGQAVAKSRTVTGRQLILRWRHIKLPARTLTGEPRRAPLAATIGALRMGEAAFVFLPGEPFVQIGLQIQDRSPFNFTAVVGYAEDYIGYIPTDEAFKHGGYECRPGRWSRLAPGSEKLVVETAVQLLNELKNAG